MSQTVEASLIRQLAFLFGQISYSTPQFYWRLSSSVALVSKYEAIGSCVKINATFIVTGAWNVVSGVTLLIRPVRAIWLLRMSTQRKWQVSAVFLIGFSLQREGTSSLTLQSAYISSALRLYYAVRYLNVDDKNYVIVKIGVWRYVGFSTNHFRRKLIICQSS